MDTNINRTVYCDMDGVLADFEGYFKYLFGVEIDTLPERGEWKHIEEYGKTKFFSELPWMPGSQNMWKFLSENFLNLKILSALGKNDVIDGQTSKGKRVWLARHLPELSDKDIILVANKHKKQHYSRPGNIVIDDTPVVITEWVQRGGIGILHKNANDTICRLEKYVYEKI